TEAVQIKFAVGEVVSGKPAKIGLLGIWISQPAVVDAIEVHNLRLQASGFQHRGKAQDADRSKLAHYADCFHFLYSSTGELVGCRRTDETDLHGLALFD